MTQLLRKHTCRICLKTRGERHFDKATHTCKSHSCRVSAKLRSHFAHQEATYSKRNEKKIPNKGQGCIPRKTHLVTYVLGSKTFKIYSEGTYVYCACGGVHTKCRSRIEAVKAAYQKA